MKLTAEQRAALRREQRAMSDQRMPLWLVTLWMVLLMLVVGVPMIGVMQWVVSLRF